MGARQPPMPILSINTVPANVLNKDTIYGRISFSVKILFVDVLAANSI